MGRPSIAALVVFACLLPAGCSQPPPVTMYPADAPPAALSAWGVVLADSDVLRLNEGVVPFAINVPLFSDYALKLRTVWMPDGEAAAWNGDDVLDFPVGTIISKTFHYEKADGFRADDWQVVRVDRDAELDAGGLSLDRHALIETRLLVRYEDGWHAYPYVWNTAQDEATLAVAGDIRKVRFAGGNESGFTYVVPDKNQCASCHVTNHASAELEPIGPKGWQMARHFDDTAAIGQLEAWAAAGRLEGLPVKLPGAPRWDAGGPADDALVRAYLDVNCAHCHNRHGPADTSALRLDRDTPPGREFGVCKPPVAVGRGSGDRPYDIYPGRPGESIMLFRMRHTDPAIAMPELGRSTVHEEAVALIEAWIGGLEGEC